MKITLAAARKNAGLTQDTAAEKLGVSRATLSNWEKGRKSPRATDIVKMCKTYSIPIENIKFF